MHRVFTRNTYLASSNSWRHRIIYSLVAYLLPAFLVMVAKLSDVLNMGILRANYGRLANSNFCWMRDTRATFLYFMLPVSVAILTNGVLYARTVYKIRKNIRSITSFKKVERIPSGSSQTSSTISIISSSTSSSDQSKSSKGYGFRQARLFTRLSVPLGFTWAIALFSSFIPPNYELLTAIMEYLFIVANTSQGLVLFIAFGVYRKLICTRR